MLRKYLDYKPIMEKDVFVAESAEVIGNVCIKEHASIWFQSVIRGDSDSIVIGKNSNIQDHCTLHCDHGHKIEIGEGVSVGHRAIIHGACVEDHCLIGMGAILLNGAHIGEGSMIGAGCVVMENQVIPKNSIVVGIPARVIKQVSEEQAQRIQENALHYVELANQYRNQ